MVQLPFSSIRPDNRWRILDDNANGTLVGWLER